jgi:mevalonate pyrophosphate decarboxylase
MARAALIAQQKLDAGEGDARFYQAKIATARFFADHLLVAGESAYRAAIVNGSSSVLALRKISSDSGFAAIGNSKQSGSAQTSDVTAIDRIVRIGSG